MAEVGRKIGQLYAGGLQALANGTLDAGFPVNSKQLGSATAKLPTHRTGDTSLAELMKSGGLLATVLTVIRSCK